MLINPIIRKEIKSSVRAWKIFGMIAAYVLIMLIISVMYLSLSNSNYNFDPRTSIYLFGVLSGFQLFFMMLIVPTIAGASISGERERQTLDILLVTRMSSYSIVFGKLVSSLLVILLLIVASAPVYSLLLFYGGLSILNILGMVLFTILTAAMGASIAIFLSTFTRKTIISTVICYIIFLSITIGNIITYYVISFSFHSIFYIDMPDIFACLFIMTNPFLSFISILDFQFGTDLAGQILRGFGMYYGGYYGGVQGSILGDLISLVPMWVYNCVINTFVIVIMTLLSSVIINPSNRRK